MIIITSPKFPLGRLVMTPGVEALLSPPEIQEMVLRHANGDWGDLCEEDRESNEEALREGNRLMSSYKSRDGEAVWVITEWDRSATTLLLPEEY